MDTSRASALSRIDYDAAVMLVEMTDMKLSLRKQLDLAINRPHAKLFNISITVGNWGRTTHRPLLPKKS